MTDEFTESEQYRATWFCKSIGCMNRNDTGNQYCGECSILEVEELNDRDKELKRRWDASRRGD